MKRGIIRLCVVLAPLLAWQVLWFFILGSDAVCSSGRCTIHRDLAILYYVVSIGSLVAIYVWRAELHIPQRFEIPIYILLFLEALWAVESFNQVTNNQVPAIQVSVDTVLMGGALFLSLAGAITWLLRTPQESPDAAQNKEGHP